MSNLVMEQLLPALQRDLLPRLKARKSDRKRVWFATVEEAYILVQEHLLKRLSELKEQCRTSIQQQEVLMHSDMQPILNTRRQLKDKIREKVSGPAEKICSESVRPHLGSVLEEMMEPISCGFLEGRQLSETKMTEACQEVLQSGVSEQLKQVLLEMERANLLSSYQKISSLQEQLQHLQNLFSFSNTCGVVHSAQIDLQQLIENAAFTFQQLLHRAVEENPENAASAIEKAKHRVLKQYDYDSSTVRKRIFQDALVSITLPFIKKQLEPSCREELQGLDQMIFSDHSSFIHLENVYESVLLEVLDKDISKVVKEAASLHKHNLFTESSRPSLSTPPSSPALTLASPAVAAAHDPLPPSPLTANGLPTGLQRAPRQKDDASVVETLLGRAKLKEEGAKVCPEAQVPEDTPKERETKPPAETAKTQIQDQSLETRTTADVILAQAPPTHGEGGTSEGADPTEDPLNPSEERPGLEEPPQISEVQLGAPPGGEGLEAFCIRLREEVESTTPSDPNSLDVSVGSDSSHSDLESTGDLPTPSDVSDPVPSPHGSEGTGEDTSVGQEPALSLDPVQVQTEAGGSAGDMKVDVPPSPPSSGPTRDETSPGPTSRPPDCVQAIRDLVVEVIEVEEQVHRFPEAD